MEQFGAYLRGLRDRNHLSRAEAAYQIRSRWGVKMGDDALRLWEAGLIVGIPALPLACLARLYGVPFDELFGALFNARPGGRGGPVPDHPAPDTAPTPRPRRPRRAARPDTESKNRSS